MTEMEKKKDTSVKMLAVVTNSYKLIPIIGELILVVGLIAILPILSPVIAGEVELDDPLTNSQITAMITVLIILWGIKMYHKIVKRVFKR